MRRSFVQYESYQIGADMKIEDGIAHCEMPTKLARALDKYVASREAGWREENDRLSKDLALSRGAFQQLDAEHQKLKAEFDELISVIAVVAGHARKRLPWWQRVLAFFRITRSQTEESQ